MYLLLLVFGWLLGVAGMVLAGSGMSLRDGTFDATILTPGIVLPRLADFFWSGSALDCERSNASSEYWRHDQCHAYWRSQTARKAPKTLKHRASQRGFHSRRREPTNRSRALLHAT
jgi:hypothetical protein